VPGAACDERCAAPHVASGDRRAVLDAASYRTLLERLVPERPEQERLELERLELERLPVPEPHLTSSARWSARQSPRRRVREG
jgi:hypothetical protein